MTKADVRARIENIGIIPAIRVSSTEDAQFAAEAIAEGGIPIVELTMTVPGAVGLIPGLLRDNPELIVGAGTVLDAETARRCMDAGANFLTSPGFDPSVVEFAIENDVVVFPGVSTPTEVMLAAKAGADFVKIFPAAQLGGSRYIKTLKDPFPHVPLMASGGVNQETALDFLLAGAFVLGIGGALIPQEAIQRRQPHRIHELARRFTAIVEEARTRMTVGK
jgi:2-dehydro-3-deoxyphosphogluconate aldolase/(4S)-4-hydroxy-2-oxoglutarate aldolase